MIEGRKPWFRWRDELPCESGIYMRRWFIDFRLFSIRIHHWLKSDDDRAFHDHPWSFITVIFKGGYSDISPSSGRGWFVNSMNAPAIAYRPARYRHFVSLTPDQAAWSLLITGPTIRRWGFWVNGKFKKANKYFLESGSHPCE